MSSQIILVQHAIPPLSPLPLIYFNTCIGSYIHHLRILGQHISIRYIFYTKEQLYIRLKRWVRFVVAKNGSIRDTLIAKLGFMLEEKESEV
jgi:hypothetical protein